MICNLACKNEFCCVPVSTSFVLIPKVITINSLNVYTGKNYETAPTYHHYTVF